MSNDTNEIFLQLTECEKLANELYTKTGVLWKIITATLKTHDSELISELSDFRPLKQLLIIFNRVNTICLESKSVLDVLTIVGTKLHGTKLTNQIQNDMAQMQKNIKLPKEGDPNLDKEFNFDDVEGNNVIDFAKSIVEKAIKELKENK